MRTLPSAIAVGEPPGYGLPQRLYASTFGESCTNWKVHEPAKRKGSANRRASTRRERRTAAGAAVVGTALMHGVSARARPLVSR